MCHWRLRRYVILSSVLRNLPSDFLHRRVCKKPLSKQRFDSLLRGRSFPSRQRKHSTRIRFRYQGGKASDVDQALGVQDYLFCRKEAIRVAKRIDKPVEIGIGQRTIHIAVALGQLALARSSGA